MSGRIYDKGVLILTGYLNGKFGQNKQLSISASITFEQSYNDIDGDSASSTELYAILSSLSNYPIKQGIAVTGSVNQLGEVQPIGGATEKIEGFFEAGEKVVVIDDLISTGGSKFEGIEKLESAGLKVEDVVVLIDRSPDGGIELRERGYQLHAVLRIAELLDFYEASGNIDLEHITAVREFLSVTGFKFIL